MVGVPGRSKACLTCKRRKFGCDQQRPSCGQCQKSRLPCEGYDQARIFVNTLSSQSQSEAKPPSLVIGSYKALVHTERRRKTLNPSKRQTSSHPTQSPLTLSIVDLANATSLSLCGSALESNCFELYWASLLPNAVTFPRCAERYSTAGWANVVQGLILKDGFDVLRLALRANALTLVGQQHANQAIIAEGWRSYGASLQMLAKLVSRRTRDVQMSEKLLSAAMLLSQYELLQAFTGTVLSAPGPTWLKHALGVEAIIKALGPDKFKDGHLHRLFSDIRLALVYPGIQNCQRSIFSSQDWKSIPWAIHPKDPKDELLDILVELPGVLEFMETEIQVSDVERRGGITKAELLLKETCWALDGNLRQWAATSGADTLSFMEALLLSDNAQSEHAPSCEDFAKAHLGLVYWATCILLYHVLKNVYLATDREHLPEYAEPRQYCRKIALLIPYVQNRKMGMFFLNVVIFPATIAIWYLAREDSPGNSSPELEMMAETLRNGEFAKELRAFLSSWPWSLDQSRLIVTQAD